MDFELPEEIRLLQDTVRKAQSVDRGEVNYIQPNKQNAAIHIDTFHDYEPCILAKYLEEIPRFREELTPEFISQYGLTDLMKAVKKNQEAKREYCELAEELIALSDSGFRLALDDFGTGFASIGYLTRMPFDELKIDRSFVRSIEEGQQGMRMVKSIIGLARAMELDIVAEGIETETDAVLLRRSGADFLQGYHFGRPLPAAEFEQLLLARHVA